MPLCVVHVSMSPCLPVCAYVAILLVSVHVGILSWHSNNPDPPSHDVVFFSQFADAGICASLVVPVRPPADATPAAVCGTMALSAVPRVPRLTVYLHPFNVHAEWARGVPGGEKFGRGEKLFGQISKPSLVPNISFNFKDSLCHIEPECAITTPFFFFTMT